MLLTNGVDEAIHLMCVRVSGRGRRGDDRNADLLHVRREHAHDDAALMKVQADESLEFPFERFLAAITDADEADYRGFAE